MSRARPARRTRPVRVFVCSDETLPALIDRSGYWRLSSYGVPKDFHRAEYPNRNVLPLVSGWSTVQGIFFDAPISYVELEDFSRESGLAFGSNFEHVALDMQHPMAIDGRRLCSFDPYPFLISKGARGRRELYPDWVPGLGFPWPQEHCWLFRLPEPCNTSSS
ncbi:MAG: hypothetical protein WC866_00115 [Patescibacteria group bacterium]